MSDLAAELLAAAAEVWVAEHGLHEGGCTSDPFLWAAESAMDRLRPKHVPPPGWPLWVVAAPRRGLHLYRLYDAQGELLYIGQSGEPCSRVKRHLREQPWAAEICHGTFESIAGHRFVVEAAAIRRERPRYNVAGVTGPYSNLRRGSV